MNRSQIVLSPAQVRNGDMIFQTAFSLREATDNGLEEVGCQVAVKRRHQES